MKTEFLEVVRGMRQLADHQAKKRNLAKERSFHTFRLSKSDQKNENNFPERAPPSCNQEEVKQLVQEVPDVYPNNLKNCDFGSVTIDQSRELSRQPKSNSSGCLGIKVIKPTQERPVYGWDLLPMQTDLSLDHESIWRQKLSKYTKTCEPSLSILLILPDEIPNHRLFLENVARTITRSFAPASVVLFSNQIFNQKRVRLILIPLSLLKKKFPKINQTHHLFTEGSQSFLPLENLDDYHHDVTCKRALWSAIQHSFPLLSI